VASLKLFSAALDRVWEPKPRGGSLRAFRTRLVQVRFARRAHAAAFGAWTAADGRRVAQKLLVPYGEACVERTLLPLLLLLLLRAVLRSLRPAAATSSATLAASCCCCCYARPAPPHALCYCYHSPPAPLRYAAALRAETSKKVRSLSFGP